MEWPVITKDTPLEEVKRIHQMIWQYVVENGKKPKTPYDSNCVCCEYAYNTIDRTAGGTGCSYCPANWGCVSCSTIYVGLYFKWIAATDPIRRRQFAEQIRDIPFKFEEEN